ncbi:MAG: amino acid permease [Steroidobacteraceae bacterium]
MSQELKPGSLSWPKVAALGVAIAISGDFVGWNYGLAVGGWGGMMLAALAMIVLFWCLTQCLAELAAAMPEAGGFDHYARRALGPGAGFLAGMAVAIALAVGAGLAMSFAQGYTQSMFGLGGWGMKLGLLAIVVGLQLRGAHEAGGITLLIGVLTVLVLAVLLLFLAPHFDAARLRTVAGVAGPTLLPGGLRGAAACVPFALFLFLGVEQAAHAATEMRDMARSISKALGTSIAVAAVLGIAVLVIVTGTAGADPLAGSADPLFAAVMAHGQEKSATLVARIVGAGALVAIIGTFFSLAYAGFAPGLPPGAGGLPAGGAASHQSSRRTGRGAARAGRHRDRDGRLRAGRRDGGVHLPDQRLAPGRAAHLHAAAARGAAAGASLPRTRRRGTGAGRDGVVGHRHGVLLPAAGARAQRRHRRARAAVALFPHPQAGRTAWPVIA